MDHKHWYNSVEEMIAAESGSDPHAGGYTKDQIETELRRWNPENDSNIVMDTARDIGRGAIALADSVVGLGDMAYNAVTGESFRPAIREMGWTPDEWDREIALRNSFARQDADAAVQDAEGLDAVGAYLANPRALWGAVAQQAPLLAGTIGGAAKAAQLARMGGAISPRAAAIAGAATAEGSLSGGSVGAAVGDHYAETGEDPGRRIALAGTAAGVGTGLIGAAMGPLGGAVEASIGARMAGRGFANAMSKTPIRRGLKSMGGEGLEEALQSGQEQAWQNYGTDAPLSEDVGTQMAVGGLLGGVMGGMLHPFTGPSAHSQKNLMPGANATGEQQRNAKTAIETEEAVRAKQELMRRQYQAQQAMEGRPMQAIPTEFTEADVPMMGGAVAGGTYITPNAPGSYQPPMGAINPSPGDMTQAPANQQMAVPEPAPQAPEVPNDLGRTMLGMSFTYPKMASDLNKRTIATSDGQGKTVKQSINEAFPSLTPTQRTYVMGSIAARKATGQLTPQNFARSVAEDIETARAYIQEDSPQALQEYVDRQAKQTVTKQSDIDYNDALNNALGSQPSDARYANMPFGQRIMEVSTGMAPQVAEQAAQPAADQTLTQQPQPEQTPPQQEAVPATPVAAQQAEAKPSQAPAETKKAIPDTVDEMAKKDTKVPARETKDTLANDEDAVPTWAADNRTTRKREARQASEDEGLSRVEAIGKRRRTRQAADKKSDGKALFSVRPKQARNMLEEVKERKYTDEQTKQYRQNYSRQSTSTDVDQQFRINDGDAMLGNDVKRLVTNFMAGKMKITPKEVVERLYDRLTPESLETVRRSVEEEATSHGGNRKPWVRWLHNALDEAVQQKKAGKALVDKVREKHEGEEWALPNPPTNLMVSHKEGRYIPDIGVPSMNMTAPTELNVEFFMGEQFADVVRAPTVANLRKIGIAYNKQAEVRDSYLATVEALENDKVRLMVSEDGDGSWGQKDKAMLKVQPVITSGSNKGKVSAKGWVVLVHENGDPATPAQQAEIFKRLFWADALRHNQRAKETGDDSLIPRSLRDMVPSEGVYTPNLTNDMDDSTPTSFMHETTSLSKLNDSAGEVVLAYNKLAKDAEKRGQGSLNQLGEDLKKLVPLVFKSNLTETNQNPEATTQIEKKHPFVKFLKGNDTKFFLHGFSDLGMFEALNADKKVTDAQLKELFRQHGVTFDGKDSIPVPGGSPTAIAVLGAWKRAAANIGRTISRLNRPEVERKALASTVRQFVRKELIQPVKIPPAGETLRSKLENAYYTRLSDIRPKVAKAFARSLHAGMAQTNHIPYRWQDREGAKDNLLNGRGNGLASGATPEAKALREQFKQYIADRFKEETGFGLGVRSSIPLRERMDFYNNMATDFDLQLRWIPPADAGKDFPKGKFEFVTDEDAGGATVEDFDPGDLWTAPWVEASGLFSDEELKGSAARAQERGDEHTVGSAELYQTMLQANVDYAKRINYSTMYGQYQEADKRVADAEALQRSMTKEQVRLEEARDTLAEFFEDNGSPTRLREDWDTLMDEIDKFTRMRVIYEDAEALKPELTPITDAMAPAFRALAERRNNEAMARYEATITPLEEGTKEQFRRVNAIAENMLKKDVHGEERAKRKKQLQNLWLDYYEAHYDLDADRISAEAAQLMDQARDIAEGRMADETIQANRKEFEEDKQYIRDYMKNRGFAELADILENGTELEQEAVLLARDTVENIANMTSFLQTSGDLQNARMALGELNRAVRRGNERGVFGDPELTKLYTDALATYMRKRYLSFGEALNERAEALHEERVKKLKRSNFDVMSDPEVLEKYNEFQQLNQEFAKVTQYGEEYRRLWDATRAALRDYLDAREAAIEREADLVAPSKVFGKGQHLSASLMADLHREADMVLHVTEDQKRFSDEEEAGINKVLFSNDGSWDRAALDAFAEKLKANPPNDTINGFIKDTKKHYLRRTLLENAKKAMHSVCSEAFFDKTLGEIKVGFYKQPEGLENACGMYTLIEDKPYIFIADPVDNKNQKLDELSEAAVHELCHHLLGAKSITGAHTLRAMDLQWQGGRNVDVYPVGNAAWEIFEMCGKHNDFKAMIVGYPLNAMRKDKDFDLPTVKKEFLAQTAAWYVSKPEWREIIAKEAPELDTIFRNYLGDRPNGNGPTEPTGRSLDGLGEKNTATKTSVVEKSRGNGGEGSLFSARRAQSERQSSRSSQGAESGAVRGTDSDTEQNLDGQARSGISTSNENSQETEARRTPPEGSGPVGSGSVRGTGASQGIESEGQVASRANPEPSFIQRVINRLPAERRPLAQAVADTAAGWFGDYGVSKFLGALFTSDLARMVNKVMPSIKKWIDLKKARDAWINTRQQELGQYRQRFNDLDKDTQAKLNTLWTDTTLSGTWIAKPQWMTAKQWKKHQSDQASEADRIALQQQYDELSPEAQSLYDDVLQYGHDSMVLKNKLIAEKANDYLRTLEESAADATELKDLKDSLKATVQMAQNQARNFIQPYVPLLRRGSHVVVARSEELASLQNEREQLRLQRREDNGWSDEEEGKLSEVNKKIIQLEQSADHYVVSFVDSQAQANRLKTELEKDFNGTVEAFPREEIGRMQSVSLGTIHELENQLAKRLDDTDAPEARKMIRKMVGVLNEMYTMNLADYHANKNQLHRLKVAGFDENMMNNFLDNGYRETLFYGNVKYQKEIQNALRDMRNESNISGGNVSREIRKRVLNEVMKREQLDYDYKPNEVFDKAQRVASVMMLLTSPAFYLQNMTQSFMMTCPWLAHDFSGAKVFKDMANNTKKMIQAYFNKDYRSGIEIDFDKVPWMTPELKEGLGIARSRGLIDIGISQDFGHLESASKFQELTDYLSRGARVVEMVNRVASFTTAFNLKYAQEKAKGNKDAVQAATNYACEAIYATHGDYSATNEPRYFKRGGLGLGGAEKLIFQFRKFQLIQIGLVMRMAKAAFAGASPEARAAGRRAFAYMLGTHFTMTGLAGTPLVTTLAFILNGIFGDDDDSTEDTLRKWIGDKDMSNLLIKGLPAYLGVDVSERIGAANMFSPFPYLNATPLSGREGALETVAAMAGPFVSQFVRMSSGLGYMSEGDMYKGVEMMLPNGLTNAMRAFRYATEGYTTKNGTVTIPPEEYEAMDVFFQALGLPTTITTDRYRLQNKLMRTQDRFSREEAKINKEYRAAETWAERRAAMQKWVKLQKERADAGLKPKPTTHLQQNKKKVDKDAKNAVGGLVVNNSNKAFVQYWANL